MCISFGLIFCTKNEILSTKAACPFSKRRRRVMKKMTRRRITALFMAVLMVVGILPLSMLTGIFSSKAQAKTVTASIDISKGLEAGKVYGDDSIVKLEVLADMPVKEGSGATVEGVKYDAFIHSLFLLILYKTNKKRSVILYFCNTSFCFNIKFYITCLSKYSFAFSLSILK